MPAILRLWKGKLLVRGGKLAVANKCCCKPVAACPTADQWDTATMFGQALALTEDPPLSPGEWCAPDPDLSTAHAVWFYGDDERRYWAWSEPDEECYGGIRYHYYWILGGGFEGEDPFCDNSGSGTKCCDPEEQAGQILLDGVLHVTY